MKTSEFPTTRTRNYEDLLEEAEPTMEVVINSQIHCPGYREDVLQESRIDLWNAHQLYAGEVFTPRALGKVIARRRCTKHRKKLECRDKYEVAYAEQQPRPTRTEESPVLIESTVTEEAQVLRRVFGVILAEFPPTRRSVFSEFFLEGLTYRQIADRHGWEA